MRKLLLILLVAAVLPVARGYGQASVYYNFRNPLHSLSAAILSTYVDTAAGVFYTAGPCWDSVNIISPGLAYPTFGVRVSKWRISDGQLLQGATVQQGTLDTTLGNNKNYALLSSGTLFRLPDGSFLTPIETIDTSNIHQTALLCMDSNGKKLWLREYEKPTCKVPREGFAPKAVRRTTTGEWIILAINTCNNHTSGRSYGDVVFMKLDSNFNLLWTKLFPAAPNYNFTPTCLLVEPDGYTAGIVLTKENTMNWSRPTEDYSQLLKVDTAGNMLWSWKSSYNEHEGINDLIRTPDGGYLYSGAGGSILIDSGTTTAQYESYNMVKKLDAARQLQWQYVDTTAYWSLNRILPLPGGDYLLTGQHGWRSNPNNASRCGALYRINSSGQLKWRRIYTPDTTLPMVIEPYDMALCGNGDLLVAGFSQDHSPNPTANIYQGWILKVDSNGCVGPLDPQCQASAGVAEVPLPRAEGPQVYPNPTTGVLKINIGNSAKIIIQDLTGRLVHSASLQAGTQELNLSALPAGMYLYQIQTQSDSAFSGKIVRQ